MSESLLWEKWEWVKWKSDPRVRRLPVFARGIWFELLGDMWLEQSPGWSGKAADLAVQVSCTEAEAERFFELADRTGVANVEILSNGDVQIVSRRRQREQKARENARERVKRHRQKKRETRVKRSGNGLDKDKDKDQENSKGESTPNGSSISKRVMAASGPGEMPRWHDLAKQILGSDKLFGKLIRDHGEEKFKTATWATIEKQPADPREFLLGCLKHENGSANRESNRGPESAVDRVERANRTGEHDPDVQRTLDIDPSPS